MIVASFEKNDKNKMNFKRDFDVFVGGTSGVFKGIKLDKKSCIMKNITSVMSITRNDVVTAMSWGDDVEKDILIGCGSNENRSVKVYDTDLSSFSGSFACDSGKGVIKGLSQHNDGTITAVESGHIKLWRFNGNNEELLETGPDLERMRRSAFRKNIIATGGCEHKLKLFDLDKGCKIFEEKNVRHDSLELAVPLWITDIGFVPNTEHVATCSKYGHVRLYDPAAQRRPVINIEVKNQALTTLAIAPRERHIVVGSGKGTMNLVDLRNPGKILNTYRDFVGSITAVACPTSGPYIVSVGLDRFLRVHHLNSNELLKKVYLTSRLSSMVLRSEFVLDDVDEIKTESKKRSRSETNGDDKDIQTIDVDSDIDAEYDTLFDNMAVINGEENEANLTENAPEKSKNKIAKLTSSKPQKKKKKLKKQKPQIKD